MWGPEGVAGQASTTGPVLALIQMMMRMAAVIQDQQGVPGPLLAPPLAAEQLEGQPSTPLNVALHAPAAD